MSLYISWPFIVQQNQSYLLWRHQMETFSALLALCAGNSPVTGEFPSQRPVTHSFDVFFDLRPIYFELVLDIPVSLWSAVGEYTDTNNYLTSIIRFEINIIMFSWPFVVQKNESYRTNIYFMPLTNARSFVLLVLPWFYHHIWSSVYPLWIVVITGFNCIR